MHLFPFFGDCLGPSIDGHCFSQDDLDTTPSKVPVLTLLVPLGIGMVIVLPVSGPSLLHYHVLFLHILSTFLLNSFFLDKSLHCLHQLECAICFLLGSWMTPKSLSCGNGWDGEAVRHEKERKERKTLRNTDIMGRARCAWVYKGDFSNHKNSAFRSCDAAFILGGFDAEAIPGLVRCQGMQWGVGDARGKSAEWKTETFGVILLPAL